MELESSWFLQHQKTLEQGPWDPLKLEVFKKCRLGRLPARFGRPLASILDGLGPIFQGFGLMQMESEGFSWWQPLCHQFVLHHWGAQCAKLSRSCRASGRLPRMPVLPRPGSDGRGAHGVGWPAVSPPWGLSMELKKIKKNPHFAQKRDLILLECEDQPKFR